MYAPLLRAAATAWLGFFELFLSPLRTLAAPAPVSEAEAQELQQEVWRELAEARRGPPIAEPIFTDELVARAKGPSRNN